MFTLLAYPRIWRRWRTRADRTRSLQTGLAALLAFVLLASSAVSTLAQDDEPDEPTRRRVPSIQIERTPTPEAADDVDDEVDDEAESPEAERDESDNADADEPADTLEAAQAAVVQIEAVGTFVDPAEGLLQNAAGSGSGFIIDPAGIAVTNNHVVTGAAFVKVYVGDEERPRSARVLGVSECSDLAVIDIEGNGFPYLEWYDGRIRVGLDVYAAGFPLGDPEFTLTRGIVAKAAADGESEWASLPSVLQHDATINPGNSGGPLLDGDGRVVGINYAGADDVSQYFAISRDQALPLIDELEAGNDVDSIGINGTAVSDGEDLSGIWVASVDSGSTADNAGVEAGDIILSMEGLSLATDGTMSDYCNILRSHDRDDVLSLRVLRYDSGEVFVGQLNGRELELSYTFGEIEETVEDEVAQNAGEEVDEETGAGDEEPVGYDEYATVTDESGRLAMDVPAAWSDVDGSEWTSDGEPLGVRLGAATDLDAYAESWGISGAFFGLIDLESDLDLEEYLDGITFEESCTFDSREPFANDTYAGYSDLWLDCGEAESALLILALLPETNAHVVYLEIGIVAQADLDAADVILNSFSVDGVGGAASGQDVPATSVNAPDGSASLFDLIDTTDMAYDFVAIVEPALGALLPAAWDDAQLDDWVLDEDEGPIGYEFYVAPDVDAFLTQWDAPGLWVRTSSSLAAEVTAEEVLDVRYEDLAEQCEYEDRVAYENSVGDTTYVGGYDIWYECGDSDNVYVVLAAGPAAGNVLSLVEMQIIDDADLEAFEALLATFYVPEATSFAADAAANEAGATPTQAGDGDFLTVQDDNGVLSVSVPAGWAESESGAWLTDDDPEPLGLQLTVSPDILGFEDENEWIAPGAYVIASNLIPSAFEMSDVLDLVEMSDSCDYDDRFDYERPGFRGEYDLWTDCDDQGVVIAWLAARPDANRDIALLIMVAMLTDEDYDAFEQILSSVEYSEPADFNALLDELAAAEIERAGSANTLDESTEGGDPVAVVLVNALNVRAGPGTNYERIDSVALNDTLLITGRNEACSWLQIVAPSGQGGLGLGQRRFRHLHHPLPRHSRGRGPGGVGSQRLVE